MINSDRGMPFVSQYHHIRGVCKRRASSTYLFYDDTASGRVFYSVLSAQVITSTGEARNTKDTCMAELAISVHDVSNAVSR